MQNKRAFATIAILSSALLAGTLALGLTVHSADAVCSPRNPNVCASGPSGFGMQADGKTGFAQTAGSDTSQPQAGNAHRTFAQAGTSTCSGKPHALAHGQGICSS